MGFGVTAPPLTDEQREKKRLAKLKKSLGACRAGHLGTSDNVHWYESVPYCAICVRAGTVTPTTVRWVYFIGDGMGHVKIGFSVNVGMRLRELQSANPLPLTVLAVLKGGCELESSLHQRFAEHRLQGEWFRLTPEIADYVSTIPKPEPAAKPAAPPKSAKVRVPKARDKPVPAYVLAQRRLANLPSE